ncbi:MAG TPA: VWA domain-containing protein [Gaiellaceae bacterium]|nr:VWA domain-containing protein [Gaiellaceae bacterium]
MRELTGTLLTLCLLSALLGFAAPAAASAEQRADIVFMLDESGSMDDEIAGIRENISGVASAVSAQMDARYALVSFGGAPPDGPAIEPFARTDFTDLEGLSRALANSGAYSAPTGEEMGFYATTFAFTALSGFRPDAGACGILVSDEPPSWKQDRASDLRQALDALDSRHATWFGIVNTSSGTVRRDYGPEPGSLADLNGGAVFSLSEFRADPSAVLASVMTRCGRAAHQAAACTITGTARADVLRGTAGNDVICALGGNDVIYARGGNDKVDGGRGNDHVLGGGGNDRLTGGHGNDRLKGAGGRDRLLGGRGRDMFAGGQGADTILARDGRRDTIFGGGGFDIARVDVRLDRLTAVERTRRR